MKENNKDRIRSSVIHDPSIIKDAIYTSFLSQVNNGSDLLNVM